MKLSIILTTLVANFATTTPNLCEDVFLTPDGSPYVDASGQTFSRHCEWVGPDAPVWDNDVCCTFDEYGAQCTKTWQGTCFPEAEQLYCEYGEAILGGGVVCYQPLLDMCDQGLCVTGSEPPATAMATLGCCSPGGACQPLAEELWDMCVGNGGSVLYCNVGTNNTDDTMDCWG